MTKSHVMKKECERCSATGVDISFRITCSCGFSTGWRENSKSATDAFDEHRQYIIEDDQA